MVARHGLTEVYEPPEETVADSTVIGVARPYVLGDKYHTDLTSGLEKEKANGPTCLPAEAQCHSAKLSEIKVPKIFSDSW